MHTHEPHDYQCRFCLLVAGGENEYNKQKDIVFQNDHTIAFVAPKWWVNNPGHVLVIPKAHTENIFTISEGLLGNVYATSKKIAEAIKESYQCDGISMRQHNEPAGNQDVWHLHVHVFPRYKGDRLYQNHDQQRFIENSEKDKYIKLLKDYFAK